MPEARYRQRFPTVEGYLHHRSPYLLVDRIVQLDAEHVVTQAVVQQESFYGQGHFPGSAILPGALMQEMTTQSAGILIAAEYNPMQEYRTEDPMFNSHALGVLVQVQHARYRSFARPGDRLEITVRLEEALEQVFDFQAEIRCDGKRLMQNRFRLANILSSVLQGRDLTPESVN